MKTTLIALTFIITGTFVKSQQINVGEMVRTARFDKIIDEVNNGPKKIKYSDIQGRPYYFANFMPAKVGDTGNTIPIRYNAFLDTVEVLDNSTGDVYEIAKGESYPKFIFQPGNEKLVLANTADENSGYFFELVGGKNRLLKKIIIKFKPEIAAPNSLLTGTPAKFETQKPIYYIKTENNIIKLTKKSEELINGLPEDKKDSVKDFIKSNKIKMTEEFDLIKLVNFINK